MTMLRNGNEIISPNIVDTELAKASSHTLATHLGEADGSPLEFRDRDREKL